MTLKGITALALGLAVVAAADAAAPADDDAALFGAREQVRQASLSPNGRSVAFVVAGQGRSSMLMTGTPDAGLKPILSTSGDPDRLEACHWSTNTRLVCSVYVQEHLGGDLISYARMISIDADGGHQKLLSAQSSSRSLRFAADGGSIVDWLGDDAGGKVLMTREFVPESSIGTHLASDKAGLGLERVDTTTLARSVVEKPYPQVVEYITDGHGTVRVRGVSQINNGGYAAAAIDYAYRLPNASGWKPLATLSTVDRTGFDPYAVDRDLNVVYGFDRQDGREALFRIALDGSNKRELVLARPDVDVDGLIRIGRQHRVVGASFATEKRQVAFFDPELKALSAKLGRALPGLPIVTFVDASDGEGRLLLHAGSDTDPGRYFLYDKATRKLTTLLDERPGMAGVKLSPVQPITFPAADGTPIPAYLTLPPGSDGKNLPAIVLPHGGPSARDEWGFDWLPQYFAHRGFAVLQPNFRGSSGYGDAFFQKNGFQGWRTAIGDVNDAGRWLVKQGIARPDRLAIVGWSYGGYAALQSAVLDPSLFKAVVAVAPVTDLVQLKADARNYLNAEATERFLGDGPWLHEGSPAQNAQRIKAPVLMFQGDEDLNVPIAQSRLMASKLRAAGASPQLVEYKGLDHQLEDSAARTDMLGKADAFLRKSMGM